MTVAEQPVYPVYVPSKGRADKKRAKLMGILDKWSVPYRIVVEEHELEAYQAEFPNATIITMPTRDLGLHTTRNWIRDHAEAEGHEKHWQIDDNVYGFRRVIGRSRIPCHAGAALRIAELFSDRYENIGISGLDYSMFAVPGSVTRPVRFNHKVYSCTLVNHALPVRWRLGTNDDVDICLQTLAIGWCTASITIFTIDKPETLSVPGGMTPLYTPDNDGRLKMARSLERMWPGVVRVNRRFGKPQHIINWDKFDNQPILKPDVDLASMPKVDEHGLVVRRVKQTANRDDARMLEDIAKQAGIVWRER